MNNLFNPPKFVSGSLVDIDGNAFALLSQFRKQSRRQGWSNADTDKVIEEAKSGDYEHLIDTLCAHYSNEVEA